MPETFDTLFDRHLVAAFDRQCAYNDLVAPADAEWAFDLPSSVVRYTNGPAIPAQLLGTELGDTWTWAWAANNPDIPDHVLNAARTLHRIGAEYAVPELTTPELSLLELNGTLASLLAMGLLRGSAFARGPFDGGAVYALLTVPSFPPAVPDPVDRVSEIFPRAVERFAFNHRRAFLAYLDHYALPHRLDPTRPDAPTYLVDAPNRDTLISASFSHLGKLLAFHGTLNSLV